MGQLATMHVKRGKGTWRRTGLGIRMLHLYVQELQLLDETGGILYGETTVKTKNYLIFVVLCL